MIGRWGNDSRYSHGYLVPLFAAFLLWSRRGLLTAAPVRPSWWGLPCLAAGLGLHFAGTYLYLDWLCGISLLPCLAAVVLLLGGWSALRWAWPGVAFLIFMVPLPFRAETALAHPLQRIATAISIYALQTLGFTAYGEGNVIRMGTIHLGVVEACSGLSMLLIFFAVCTAVAVLVPRRLDKACIVASAVPIALAANITRITVTGILYKTAGSRWADLVFHDLAGWLMMVLALGMLWLEFRALAWILVPAPVRELVPVHLAGRTGSQAKRERKTIRPRNPVPLMRRSPQ
ncbi:MAG: exosortase/archaeosortase family protein [Gemmataceae bacterium]